MAPNKESRTLSTSKHAKPSLGADFLEVEAEEDHRRIFSDDDFSDANTYDKEFINDEESLTSSETELSPKKKKRTVQVIDSDDEMPQRLPVHETTPERQSRAASEEISIISISSSNAKGTREDKTSRSAGRRHGRLAALFSKRSAFSRFISPSKPSSQRSSPSLYLATPEEKTRRKTLPRMSPNDGQQPETSARLRKELEAAQREEEEDDLPAHQDTQETTLLATQPAEMPQDSSVSSLFADIKRQQTDMDLLQKVNNSRLKIIVTYMKDKEMTFNKLRGLESKMQLQQKELDRKDALLRKLQLEIKYLRRAYDCE